MKHRKSSRVALVTGASYGIGAAIAVNLAQDGFDIVVTDMRAVDLSNTLVRIAEKGAHVVPVALDLRSQSSIEQAMTDAVAAFGHLDVLVNNAGVPSLKKPAMEVTRDEWDVVQEVNLTGTFFMTQQMGRHLIASGKPGAVISVASTHGVVGFAGASTYGIAKAGIIHMTKMLAIEWAKHGIRVNAIAPGTTETESRAPSLADPQRREMMLNRIPLRQFGSAEDMAAAVCYLASPQAAYITGQTLVLDGGLTAE